MASMVRWSFAMNGWAIPGQNTSRSPPASDLRHPWFGHDAERTTCLVVDQLVFAVVLLEHREEVHHVRVLGAEKLTSSSKQSPVPSNARTRVRCLCVGGTVRSRLNR
ncbi:unnamed protein product, partial [Mycena citricolor]